MWVQAWTYLLKHSDKILEWTLQHLYIILVANACAVVIGVLVGIFISGKGNLLFAPTWDTANFWLEILLSAVDGRRDMVYLLLVLRLVLPNG